jgi:predicted dinucleotide-binding enzyme
MIRLDPETMQTPQQEVEELDIIMVQIPIEALYGLQASVMQEVQSRACIDATNPEVDRGVAKMLQVGA